MAIGSAIERGSLICMYDERGTTLFQKAKDQAPRTDCWDSRGPPSPFASARSSTPTASVVRRYSPRPHDGLSTGPPVQHPVRVDSLDRGGSAQSARGISV